MQQAPVLPSVYNLVALESCGSTNDEARRLAEEGAPEGTLVWALEQTAGRGRHGRTWASPHGNFYASLVLRPETPLKDAAQLGFVAALAVFDTIGTLALAGLEVATKWPNDVMITGRKVAGILLESKGAAGPEAVPDYVILGVGVNLINFPDKVDTPATCLSDEGANVLPVEFLEAFARHFLNWVRQWTDDGFEKVRRHWTFRCGHKDREIQVRLPNETVGGIFRGLDDTGAMLLETPAGTRTIAAGEVFFGPGNA